GSAGATHPTAIAAARPRAHRILSFFVMAAEHSPGFTEEKTGTGCGIRAVLPRLGGVTLGGCRSARASVPEVVAARLHARLDDGGGAGLARLLVPELASGGGHRAGDPDEGRGAGGSGRRRAGRHVRGGGSGCRGGGNLGGGGAGRGSRGDGRRGAGGGSD